MQLNSFLRFTFNKKKCIIGACLGLFTTILLYTFRDTYINASTIISFGFLLSIPFATFFIFVGAINLRTEKPSISLTLNILWTIACAVASLFWGMTSVESIAIWRMPLLNLCLNIILFFSFSLIVYALIGKWRISVNVVMILYFCIASINSFVWQFRGREILFTDLHSTGTALMVAKEFLPTFSLRMALGLSLWLLVFFSQFSLPPHCSPPKKHFHMICLLTALCMLVTVGFSITDLKMHTWGGSGSNQNGFFINFALSIRDSFVKEPENYSETIIQDITSRYLPAENTGNTPNIIIIMNESFVDLRVLGDNFKTNQSVMPFYDSLKENTIKGYALASVYGGSTANSEFEFLTGSSMSFYPSGSTPYQQYISNNLFSLPWLLASYGYDTLGTHPFSETSWSRSLIYPFLGFNESSFIDDYPQQDFVRNWVSDKEMYNHILKKLSASSNQKQFIFGITMQNHGGYAYNGDDFTPNISLVGYSKEYPAAEQYLSLVNESDRALEYFLTALEENQNNTIVLFFGDHFPGLSGEFYNEIHGGAFSTLDEQMLKYTVPFFIWANYDIEEYTVECTSLNYLSRYLLEAAGFNLPEYYSFLSDLEQAIPSMNTLGYYSNTEDCYLPYEEAEGKELEWIHTYNMVQYNQIFDKLNTNDVFFTQYLPN